MTTRWTNINLPQATLTLFRSKQSGGCSQDCGFAYHHGAEAYDTLWILLALTPPREKTLTKHIKETFAPVVLIVVERFQFYKHLQRYKSNTDIFVDLRQPSIESEFGDFLGQDLQGRSVCGIHSDIIQKKRVVELKLTVKRAKRSQGMETVTKDVKDFKDADTCV